MSTTQHRGQLAAAGIDIERGGRLVISELSFSVKAGQALLLTGPNGAGKTTLIRALAGLIPVQGGQFDFLPNDNSRASNDEILISEQCHYVGHANAAKPELTVRENLTFWARFMGQAPVDEAPAMADLGLAALADIPVRYLSAGQQRRVALARLRVAERPIWLLDEPTVSLDAANTKRLVALGDSHLAAGGIIIAATHIPLEFTPRSALRLTPVEDATYEPIAIDAGLNVEAAR